VRHERIAEAAQQRGGVTPFNLIPVENTQQRHGHGAGTPYRLAEWWTKYISPPGGVVLDMCMGVGTMGLAALNLNRSFIGIERDAAYYAIAERRIADAAEPLRHMGVAS
jgi:DNA modification methylase